MVKQTRSILALIALSAFLLTGSAASGQPDDGEDRTLSPYFFVKSDDPELDQLPLKSTSVRVNISGVIADVTVNQVYKNEGAKPLEAIYVFPASTRAAVYGLKMTIGERTIVAQIRKREEARAEYEQAKNQGKSASLLEQHRPNIFQMNVANILPSDVIDVELKYTELLVPTDAVYEFVYPTVVGPLYANSSTAQEEGWIQNPYLHQGTSPTYTFHMAVTLSAGLPIQNITCPSHKVNVQYSGPAAASMDLDPSENFSGNRDFIVRYRLAGGRIETGLLLFEGEKENFFLLMLQPHRRVSEPQIPPREYVFIVDVSGSMHGFPLDISKQLLRDLIGNLRPTDRFNVLLFAGGSSIMSDQSLPANPENVAKAIALIERQRGGGGTELLPALSKALSLPKAEGFSRSLVIATDGYVAIEEEAFDLIRNNLGNANFFAFGIGSSVNRYLIEGMARVGMGEPFVVTKPEEAQGKAEKFRKLIQSPVLTGIKVDFDNFQAYDVEPYGVPDVLAQRPVIVFGKWRGTPKGTIQLTGIAGDGVYTRQMDVSQVKSLRTNSALRYLWARHRIMVLSDYNRLSKNDERVQEVTNLGLTYNLLTAYTSFVAIDTEVRAENGKVTTVKQPLPLPHGVSDYAVGRGLSRYAPGAAMGKAIPQAREQCESLVKDASLPSQTEHVELKEITVTGGLSRSAVQAILEREIPSFNRCYEELVKKGASPKGELVLRLKVNHKGEVTRIHVEKSVEHGTEVEACMTQKLKTLRFPGSAARSDVTVIIAFSLK